VRTFWLQLRLPLFGTIFLQPHQLQLAWRRDYDVLVLNWNARFVFLLPSLLVCRLTRKAVVLWGHGFSKSPAGWRTTIRNFVARLANAVVLYDDKTAVSVRQEHPNLRVFVAPNAIDQTKTLESLAICTDDALLAFRTEEELLGNNLLFVSRLQHGNQLDVAIKALSYLPVEFTDSKLLIVGDDPDDISKELQDIAAKAGVADRVRLLGPIYDPLKLCFIFKSSAAFIYPSNIGLSILHAFGYGLPVVMGNDFSKHNPEAIYAQDRKNCLLFEHSDPESCASKLAELLGSDSLRHELAQGAWETAHKWATLDKMVDGFRKALEYVLANK
ncbi:MAG: glycosyltransferase family 4 protein, partial [bacterium]|nr:glycosyltransferase family 4 protein [bacterium]